MFSKTPSKSYVLCLAGLAALAAGCSVKAVTIGTKSSLERQLIGELEPLSEEELLAASVRAQGGMGLAAMDAMQARAVAARRRQLFNRDDIDELKGQGCLGEDAQAKLVVRSCPPGEAATRGSQLVREENDDRSAVIEWALAADATLTPADRPQIVQLYRRLLHDRAQKGEWLQKDDGAWEQR